MSEFAFASRSHQTQQTDDSGPVRRSDSLSHDVTPNLPLIGGKKASPFGKTGLGIGLQQPQPIGLSRLLKVPPANLLALDRESEMRAGEGDRDPASQDVPIAREVSERQEGEGSETQQPTEARAANDLTGQQPTGGNETLPPRESEAIDGGGDVANQEEGPQEQGSDAAGPSSGDAAAPGSPAQVAGGGGAIAAAAPAATESSEEALPAADATTAENGLAIADAPQTDGGAGLAGAAGEGGFTSSGPSAPVSPEADPGFQAVVAQSNAIATEQRAHGSAASISQTAQDAAESPASEVESQAQERHAGEMAAQEPGTFDAQAFKSKILTQLESIMPANEEEAERFKEENQVDAVRDSVVSEIGDERERAAAPIEEKAKEAPDASGIEPRVATPMVPLETSGAAPAAIDATQAAPKPKSEGEVSAPLQANSQELDRQMAEADITDEQLANSNEPTFAAALDAKNEAKAHAQTAPGAYRQAEQGILAQAQTNAQGTVDAQSQGMYGQREGILAQVSGLQGTTKGQDEQKRAEVASHINGIYERVKSDVETSLNGLDGEVTSKFETAANHAKQLFEDHVAQKMEAYKKERYGEWYDVSGWGKRIKDSVFNLPPEVNAFFVEGRQKYIDAMDAPLTEIATLVADRLNGAKQKIAEGRQEIQDYVQGLPENLRQVGQEAAQSIQSKFDELEQNVDSKQDELVNTITQQYRDNLQAVDDRIEEMKSQNQGWFDKAKNAIAGTFKTIMEVKSMLLGVLADAAGAIAKIIQDPIGFLGNLIQGVKQGFNNFIANIGQHLQGGLVAWLTGAMGGLGIQIPQDVFSLKGIFELVTQILGVTWNFIRNKAAKMFGEPVVAAMEQGSEMLQALRDNGPAGLWEHIQDQFTDLKESVMGQLKDMLVVQVIQAGVTWIFSLLNPASAFVRAAKMIVDIVMFFVNRGSQIMALVQAITKSVSAIANGAVEGAAQLIEGSLAKALPVVIGFLASLAGVNGLANRVQKIVGNIRKRIDKAIDKLLRKAKKMAQGLLKKMGLGGKADDKDTKTDKVKGEKQDRKKIGKTIHFNAEDENHRLWIVPKGNTVDVMVASNPKTVEEQLDYWTRHLYSLEKKDDKSEAQKAQKLIEEARGQLSKTETAGKRTLQEMLKLETKQGSTNDVQGANKEATVAAEQALVKTLKKLFDVFGGENLFEPSVGTYGKLQGKGKGQEAHHVPPKGLFKWIVGQARAVYEDEMNDEERESDRYQWIEQLADTDSSIYDPGNPLAAISINKHTHIKKSGDPNEEAYRVHWGTETAKEVLRRLEGKGLRLIYTRKYDQLSDQDKREYEELSKEAEESLSPQNQKQLEEHEDKFKSALSTQFFSTELNAALEEEAELRDKELDTFKKRLGNVSKGAYLQAHTAVTVALENSDKDGPKDKREVALSELETVSKDTWNEQDGIKDLGMF